LEGGEDADFDFEMVEVGGLNGLEPGIVESGGAGIFGDGEVEGLKSGEVSDATSEIVVMREGDEACVVLAEWEVDITFMDLRSWLLETGVVEGNAGDVKEGLALRWCERIGLCHG
jgi:hypothetical protein